MAGVYTFSAQSLAEIKMQINETPYYDQSENSTGCCPKFNPKGWDDQTLHFENKVFVRAKTRSLMRVPLNMGPVFNKTFKAIEDAGANDNSHSFILSRDLSAWSAEHLFSVSTEVPGQKMVRLNGEYRTKVFEGAYRDAPKWAEAFEDQLEHEGCDVEEVYFFYTLCPKCAKAYGKNYVVAVAKVEPDLD